MKKILLVVGTLIVALVAVIGVQQKNNIQALYMGLFGEKEVLTQQTTSTEEKRESLLNEYNIVLPPKETEDVPEKSDDDEKGDISVDATEAPEGDSGAETETAPVVKPETSDGKQEETEPDSDAKISAYIAQLYEIEDTFVADLEEIIQATKDEYDELPKEKKTNSKKFSIVYAKMSTLLAMEKSCDAQVDEIITLIEKELKAQGKDTGLATEIRTVYEESKQSWKAAKLAEFYS